jgi:signal recognition particle GTPase
LQGYLFIVAGNMHVIFAAQNAKFQNMTIPLEEKNKNVNEENLQDADDSMKEMDEFIRRKNIQNKVLKEILDKLKKHPVTETKEEQLLKGSLKKIPHIKTSK